MDYFVREHAFPLQFAFDSWTFDVPVCHKRATLERVHSRTEQPRDAYGTLPSRTVGVLFVRDKGDPAQPRFKKRVVVVRRTGEVTRIPEHAGPLLGVVLSGAGKHQWLVHLAREPEESSPLGTGSTPAKAVSPPPPSSSEARPGVSSDSAPRGQSPPLRDDALYQLDEGPQTAPPQKPETPPRSEAR